MYLCTRVILIVPYTLAVSEKILMFVYTSRQPAMLGSWLGKQLVCMTWFKPTCPLDHPPAGLAPAGRGCRRSRQNPTIATMSDVGKGGGCLTREVEHQNKV